jgi:molybdopterin synthase catalytic subunit
MLKVSVQIDPFDVAQEQAQLTGADATVGAVASFVGLVRDTNAVGQSDKTDVATLTLEHYPGMTEQVLSDLANETLKRWSLNGITIIHRIGELKPTDPIVLVMTSSKHRGDAFDSCQYIMDRLKTDAPFWKKEVLPDGSSRWVDSRECDTKAAQRWEQ